MAELSFSAGAGQSGFKGMDSCSPPPARMDTVKLLLMRTPWPICKGGMCLIHADARSAASTCLW